MTTSILLSLALATSIPPLQLSDRDILYAAHDYTCVMDNETGHELEITATLADGTDLTFPVPGCIPINPELVGDYRSYRGYRYRKDIGARWTWVILNLDPRKVQVGTRIRVVLDGATREVRVIGREGRGFRLAVPLGKETVR
jgi:hypothetical protein